MTRSINTFARSTLLVIVALCGIASVARPETEEPASPRLLIRSALLADLANDPPPPPELLGTAGDSDREEDAGDRPVYRKAWFLVAAAGAAVLAAGLISQHDGSSGSHDSIRHLGFPPPPNGLSLGFLLHERRDR